MTYRFVFAVLLLLVPFGARSEEKRNEQATKLYRAKVAEMKAPKLGGHPGAKWTLRLLFDEGSSFFLVTVTERQDKPATMLVLTQELQGGEIARHRRDVAEVELSALQAHVREFETFSLPVFQTELDESVSMWAFAELWTPGHKSSRLLVRDLHESRVLDYLLRTLRLMAHRP